MVKLNRWTQSQDQGPGDRIVLPPPSLQPTCPVEKQQNTLFEPQNNKNGSATAQLRQDNLVWVTPQSTSVPLAFKSKSICRVPTSACSTYTHIDISRHAKTQLMVLTLELSYSFPHAPRFALAHLAQPYALRWPLPSPDNSAAQRRPEWLEHHQT